MEIERFAWTGHARERLSERRLDPSDVEEAIKARHSDRAWRSRRSTTTPTEKTRVPSGSSLSGGLIPSWRAEPALPLIDMFAYYDSDADIAWFPTGESDDVVSERVPGGLRDYDRTTHRMVAIEVWDASTRLPASILEALPAPGAAHQAAA